MAYTETFTASNNTQVSALTGWVAATTFDMDIQSNCAAPDRNNVEQGDYYDGGTFANDQYSQVVWIAQVGGVFAGPAVRMSSGGNYYGVYTSGDNWAYLFSMVGDSWAEISSTSPDLAINDVFRLEIEGTALTAKRNGNAIAGLSGSDSALSSGKAGITGYEDNAGARIDNWEGGDIGGATPTSIAFRRNHKFQAILTR